MGATTALNITVGIIVIFGVVTNLWWLARWERRDRRDYRAVARALDHTYLETDSFEFTQTLMEVRARRAERRPDREFVDDYLDGVRERADGYPPLRSV